MLRIVMLIAVSQLMACHGNINSSIEQFEFGYLTVPEDYQHPSDANVKIYYAIHHANLPQQRIGTLFFNFGGPGNDAAAILQELFNENGETLPALQ